MIYGQTRGRRRIKDYVLVDDCNSSTCFTELFGGQPGGKEGFCQTSRQKVRCGCERSAAIGFPLI
jgi:hypothetical protein